MQKIELCAFADEADSQLLGQIAALKRNNIKNLEIRGMNGKNIAEITVPEIREIKKQLDDSGIKVWAIGSPTGKSEITSPFVSCLDEFSHILELADILNASHYRMFSFLGTNGDVAYKDEVLERLSRILEKSKGSGIVLCHENEKDIYGDTAKRCQEIHSAIPEIKAVFDPANFIQCNESSKDAWEMLKPYIEYLHIKDALADGTVVPAGEGIGAIPEIAKEYSGKIATIEPHLHIFDGLANLENGKMTQPKNSYPTAEVAFDTAVESFKAIIR